MPSSARAEFSSDHELVSTRDFTATREEVFGAFSDPAQLALWWGPNGFTNRIDAFELRVGGAWRLTMIGPDGTEYQNRARFTAVARPAKIGFVHEEPVHGFEMTMTFTERPGGGTTLEWRMRFETAAEFARVRDFIVAANEQNFDRLAAQLTATEKK